MRWRDDLRVVRDSETRTGLRPFLQQDGFIPSKLTRFHTPNRTVTRRGASGERRTLAEQRRIGSEGEAVEKQEKLSAREICGCAASEMPS
jgi:hypothetical protein